MKIDRRHVLKFLGGSALGTALSPLPWKVLDDVSIWTQNWSWIPVPPKGETVIRHTTCSLCPAGCGVKVRCIGTQPVALSGLPGHPTSHGFLCPGGLLGHHLPYDPRRITQPVRLDSAAHQSVSRSPEQILSDLGKALARLKTDASAGRFAIIDSLPGRSTSLAYRQLASQFPGGTYIVPADGIKKSLCVFNGVFGAAYPELGIDVERAGSILSFGADLFEGWGTPGRLLRKQQESDAGLRLTQIEPRYSNTAAMAESWLPIWPGTEPILALGLAGVIIREKAFNPGLSPAIDALNQISDFRDLLAALPPERTAEICGISAEAISRTAQEIAAHPPCLALLGGSYSGGPFGEDDYLSVNLLNLLTGALGAEGGLVPRRALPEIDPPVANLASPTDLAGVPDESIGFLMIDGTVARQSIPSAVLRRKLVRDKAVVVSFSSVATEYADLSHYVLPVPVYLEAFQEIPTAPDFPVAAFSFSVPLLSPPPAATSPVEWVNRLAGSARLDWAPLSTEALAEARIKAISGCKRGSVYSYADGAMKSNSDFASAEELGKAFRSGASWLDSAPDPVKPELTKLPYFQPETWGRLKRQVNQRIEVRSKPADETVTLMPFATAFVATASPLAGKLTRESDLYPRAGDALISPSTASRLALQEGQRAELETGKGRLGVRIRLNEAAVPGTVFVPISGSDADPRNLCEISEDSIWRATPAKLRRLDV